MPYKVFLIEDEINILILLFGILLLLNHNPFKTLPQIQLPVLHHPFGKAYTYGLLYGPIALPLLWAHGSQYLRLVFHIYPLHFNAS